MEYVIILAGGVGSRFWPLSSSTEPKQFLNIGSKRPMLIDAFERLKPLVDIRRIYVATSARHEAKVRALTRSTGIPQQNILFEPLVKNTLAPIVVLSERIYRQDPDALIAVVPCDHFVRNVAKFRQTLRKAFEVARRGLIVTCGFPPTRPETGYGYIKVKGQGAGYFPVDRFLEKPDEARAARLVKDKRYYWNGGVFVFGASTMLEEVRAYVPRALLLARRMKNDVLLHRLWPSLPSISIDYAVMERTRKAALVPARYGWLDLGSWQAVSQVMKKDTRGNIQVGTCVDAGSTDTLSWSQGRVIATVGLRGVIVVETPDAVLVCAKDRAQDVKKIVEMVKKLKRG